MKTRVGLLLAAVALAGGSCTTIPGLPFGAILYDGNWRLTSNTSATATCVRISTGLLVRYDTGCNGTTLVLQNVEPGVVTPTGVIWRANVAFQSQRLILEMSPQNDGSLVGIQTFEGIGARAGEVSTEAVMMVRI